MSRSAWITRAGVALLTTLSAGVCASPALAAATGAARVLSPTQIEVRAGSGNANSVTITRSGRTVTIDDRVPLRASKGCTAVKGDKTRVRCTTTKNPGQVRVSLGDGDDILANRTSIPAVVFGGTGNDTLAGGTGGDALNGEAGNDKVYGGAGNDKLWGIAGNDLLRGGAGNDALAGGDGIDSIFAEDGDDKVWGQAGNDAIRAGNGNDHVYGDIGHDFVDGGAGNDRVWGHDGDDKLHGGEGDNYLDGGSGRDVITSGSGDDVIHAGAGDRTGEGIGWNEIRDGLGNDRIYGSPIEDRLYQSAFDAKIGDSDLFDGGQDIDMIWYGARTAPITADPDGVSGDDGQAGEHDTLSTGVESIHGGTGADRLRGLRLVGSAGNDTLVGTVHSDRIYGEQGADRIEGGDGADILFGGSGRDTLAGGAGDDYLDGDQYQHERPSDTAADLLLGGEGRDTVSYRYAMHGVRVDLDAETGDDGVEGEGDTVSTMEDIVGSEKADVLIGDDGANKIDSGSGQDVIDGLGGNDRLVAFTYARDNAAVVRGGEGDDHITGFAGRMTAHGGPGDDHIRGGHLGGNSFFGEAGDDTLDARSNQGANSLPDAVDGGDNGTSAGDGCLVDAGRDTVTNCER